MDIAVDAVALTTHDQRQLAVRLQSQDAVHHVYAGTFQRARPYDVVFFVEARLELDEHRNMFAVFAGFHQRINDGRTAANAVEGHFDCQHVGIFGGRANEINHGRKRVIGMVQQDVLPPNGAEDIALTAEDGWHCGGEGAIFETRAVKAVQFHQAGKAKRPAAGIDRAGIELQFFQQRVPHSIRHPRANFQAHAVAKTALANPLLNGQEQIVRFIFLNFNVGVANDPKRVRRHDFHPHEKVSQVGGNHLLDPDKGHALVWEGCRAVLRARQRRQFVQGNQPREVGRHFDAGKPLTILGVVDQHGQI